MAYTTPVHSSWIRIKEGYIPECEGEAVPYIYEELEQNGFPMYGAFKLYNHTNGKLIVDLKCQPGGNLDVIFIPNTREMYDSISYSLPRNGFKKTADGNWIVNKTKPCRYMYTMHQMRKNMFLGIGTGWESLYSRVGDLFYFGDISDPVNGAVVGNYTSITDYVLVGGKPQKVRTYFEPPQKSKVKLLSDIGEPFSSYPSQPVMELPLHQQTLVVGLFLTIREDGKDITPKTGPQTEVVIYVEDPEVAKKYAATLWRNKDYYNVFPQSDQLSFNDSTYPRSFTEIVNDILNRQAAFKFEIAIYVIGKDGISLTILDKPIWPYQPFPPTESLQIRPGKYFLPSSTVLAAENLQLFDRDGKQIYPSIMAMAKTTALTAVIVDGIAPLGWTYATTDMDSIRAEAYIPNVFQELINVQTAVRLSGTEITNHPIIRQIFLPLVSR